MEKGDMCLIDIIRHADRALYDAKNSGRKTVHELTN